MLTLVRSMQASERFTRVRASAYTRVTGRPTTAVGSPASVPGWNTWSLTKRAAKPKSHAARTRACEVSRLACLVGATAWLSACSMYDDGLLVGDRLGVGDGGALEPMAIRQTDRPDSSTPSDEDDERGDGWDAATKDAPNGDGVSRRVAGGPDGAGTDGQDGGMLDGGVPGADSVEATSGDGLEANDANSGEQGDRTATEEPATEEPATEEPAVEDPEAGSSDQGSCLDPSQPEPGTCGCPDSALGQESCVALTEALAHRYSFSGSGSEATDSVGEAHGTGVGAGFEDGLLTLGGGTARDHATLPSGLISKREATTIEFWIHWSGGDPHQRVVSFGTVRPTQTPANCPDAAIYDGGSWYRFCVQRAVTWNAARTRCENAGGNLLAIGSEAEQRFITSSPQLESPTWFGANDQEMEGRWSFASPEGLSAGPHLAGLYTNWGTEPAEPDDSDPDFDCGYVSASGTWGALDCSETRQPFVCEWSGLQGTVMDRGVWFTPADEEQRPRLVLRTVDSWIVARGQDAFPVDAQTHVALVLDPAGAGRIALVINGEEVASAATDWPLSDLRDGNNWLGRSHIDGDPALAARVDELRVYDRALSADELATSHQAGPDPEFLSLPRSR